MYLLRNHQKINVAVRVVLLYTSDAILEQYFWDKMELFISRLTSYVKSSFQSIYLDEVGVYFTYFQHAIYETETIYSCLKLKCNMFDKPIAYCVSCFLFPFINEWLNVKDM